MPKKILLKEGKGPNDPADELSADMDHVSKMAAIGEMGAAIVHELNQPLMAISSHIETLLINETLSKDQNLKNKMVKIKDQFSRLRSIVKRLNSYSKAQKFLQWGSINDPIEDALFLFAQLLKDHNIKVQLTLAENLPSLKIDRYQLQDIIINFLLNARDAIDDVFHQKEGGAIEIFSLHLEAQRVVVLGVKDNGLGIVPSTEEKIFKSFFTTKGRDKGTGLGLYVCKHIVENHRGFLHFVTLSCGEKIFYFVLPENEDQNISKDRQVQIQVEEQMKKR